MPPFFQRFLSKLAHDINYYRKKRINKKSRALPTLSTIFAKFGARHQFLQGKNTSTKRLRRGIWPWHFWKARSRRRRASNPQITELHEIPHFTKDYSKNNSQRRWASNPQIHELHEISAFRLQITELHEIPHFTKDYFKNISQRKWASNPQINYWTSRDSTLHERLF